MRLSGKSGQLSFLVARTNARVSSEPSEMSISTADRVYHTRRVAMNGKLV